MARNQFSSLSLCTTRTMPQYQMLVFHSAFYLSSHILPRGPQERHKFNKPPKRTVPCELVRNSVSSHSGMARDPIQPHSVPGRDIVSSFWHCRAKGGVVLTAWSAYRAAWL